MGWYVGRMELKAWIGACLLCALAASGQAVPGAPGFEVASIRPSGATDGHNHIMKHAESSEFVALNVSAKMLLAFAYDLPVTRVVGGPSWLDGAMWDVQAKSGPEADARIGRLDSDAATAEKRRMVQGLLAERFGLKGHEEQRAMPIYALVVAKGGAKMGLVQTNGTTINRRRDRLEVQGSDSVGLLAEQLAIVLGRVVVNETGLRGRYDLKLRWAPDGGAADGGAADGGSAEADRSVPGIFTALEEQLGLRLEAKKGMVGVLVVDEAVRPGEN